MKKENYLKIPEIIVKEINQEANEEEINILQEWLSQSEANQLLFEKFKNGESLYTLIKEHEKIDGIQAWNTINKKINKKQTKFRMTFSSALKYAAVFAIPLLVGAYFLTRTTTPPDSTVSFHNLDNQVNQFKESSLIMADGTIVSLSAFVEADSIVEIDGTQITKDKSEILYSSTQNTQQEIQYNTLITPKSKVFNVTLSDGSKVWLNASSAIKYPTQFSSDFRKVYLTGEAFFEVTKDAVRPFLVSTKDMEIEVTGTTFNVMAYPEDNLIETTLVTGEVKVKTSDFQCVLEPGKQAKLDLKSKKLNEIQVNTELYTSWKDGKYMFEYINIESVLTKLSRWYDVDVFYSSNTVKNFHFTGTLYKYNDIKQTLHIIELATNVKFEINEKTVMVSKK